MESPDDHYDHIWRFDQITAMQELLLTASVPVKFGRERQQFLAPLTRQARNCLLPSIRRRSVVGVPVVKARLTNRLTAVDAVTGMPLWLFQISMPWKASPMTYVFDQKQHIAVTSASTISAFALVD